MEGRPENQMEVSKNMRHDSEDAFGPKQIDEVFTKCQFSKNAVTTRRFHAYWADMD